jgi:hypothetical protein
MWALFPPRPQVLRHDGMRKITEANQCSRQLHSAQRYRLVCTEAQVVVAVHAAGDAAGTTLRQLSFTASSPRTPACAPTRTRYTELTATHNGLPVQPYGRLLSLTRFLPRGAGRRGG